MQSGKLHDKVAIVTGAGGKPSPTGAVGTGRAIAVLLAQEGARIVIVDRHEDRAKATRRQIEEAGGAAAVVIANLAEEADCKRIVDEAVRAFGRVDILVNNAAVSPLKTLLDTSVEDLNDSITVNLVIPFLLTKAALPEMIRAGGGSIINISTLAAIRGAAVMPAYSAAKAGMTGLTISTAAGYGKDGIRCNAIVVGAIDTPLRRATMPGEYVPRVAALATEGDSWDIAKATVFLAGPDAAHITGVLLPVDSGNSILTP